MQRLHGFRGHTSGSARWLISRAPSHTAVAGLLLSGERMARPGHVPAPDPYSCRGSPVSGPCRGSDLTRRDLGPIRGTRHALFGVPDCTYRGPVSLCGGPDSMMHPGVYYLFSPRGALRPAHAVGSGAVLRVDRRRHTCTASSYCIRGYP
jgi:hypothetical protein